jgi:RNA polymerase sigma-70 factor (ECF subfamily)
MIGDRARRLDFKDKSLPDIEDLLRFSIWLTKNGRDAARLMREAMREAYQSCDESMPQGSCKIWLHRILLRRFTNGFQQYSRPPVPVSGDNAHERLVKKDKFFVWTNDCPGSQSSLVDECDDEVNYFRAIASLPEVFRPAMILSCLEGFSGGEIANLAGSRPHAVDSLLERGRMLLQEQLFKHLMGDSEFDTVADRATESG